MANNYSIDKSKMASFIRIVRLGLSDTGKTFIWSVMDRDECYALGTIKWYGHWRGYAFFPEPHEETLYEQTCLREIADFIERETKRTRSRWRKK